MKKFLHILLVTLTLSCAAVMTGCHEPDDPIDELVLDRVLSPLQFKLAMEANVNATFTWTPMSASKEYLIQLVREDGAVYDERTLIYDPEADENMMKAEFPELPASSKFTARLSALSADERMADSKPVEIAFQTGIENLFLADGVVADEDVTATTAVMRWKAGATVTHLDVDNGVGKIELDETAVADGVYMLTELTTGKTYTVQLYNEAKDAYRGKATFVASDKIDVAVDDKTAASVTIGWGADVTLTAVGIRPEGVEDASTTMTDLSADAIAARSFTFDGLKPLSEYRISVYNDGIECGAFYVTTLGGTTVWDFTTWEAVSWEENTTVNDLMVMAASGKAVTVEPDDEGVMRLNLGGKSTIAGTFKETPVAPTQRALKISVSGEGVLVLDCSLGGNTGTRNFWAYVDAINKNFGPVATPEERGKIYIPCPGIQGAASVYIFIDNTIRHLYKMEWYEGAEAPGQNAEKLASPVVKCQPEEVTKGDAAAVKFSWDAVANAATYDYKIKVTRLAGEAEQVETISGTTAEKEYTLAASVVAALKPGSYTFSVNAIPASDYKYAPSLAGTAALTVNDTKLAAPAVSLAPAKVTVGDASDVVASWAAVEGAESYDVTFNGGAVTRVTAPSYTIAGSVVAGLSEGEYTISVVAKPAAGAASQPSDAGTAALTVAKAQAGPGTAQTWGADFFKSIAAKYDPASGGAAYKDDFSDEGLTFTNGGGSGVKFSASSSRIQLAGGGNKTKCCLSFTVDAPGVLSFKVANTGSSAGRYAMVEVDDAYKSLPTDFALPETSAQQSFEVDLSAYATAGSTVYLYSGSGGMNVFEIVWTPAAAQAADYTVVLSADKGALGTNIQGLPTAWAATDTTWTAVDATGGSTLTFTGNVYYSTSETKNIVWYFNKGKAETHVSCGDLGRIRRITMTLDSAKKSAPLTVCYDASDASKVIATTEDPAVNSTTFTYDFEAKGIQSDYFKVLFDDKSGNLEVHSVTIEYSK